ncbi:MAG: 50S ribosomal protein L18 [Elusimicrobiota bacterium]|nr:MAG: 50S ribosomal protein L18 [Elusimicrobiota bacterium]
MKNKWVRAEFRKQATRKRLFEHRGERPRLTVHRSLKYIYAQVIDDAKGVTLAAASSLDPELRKALKSHQSVDAAKKVGESVAAKAVKAGVKKVTFDRGQYVYHGRIKALADAARAAGLEF